jgi:hypothetical protein
MVNALLLSIEAKIKTKQRKHSKISLKLKRTLSSIKKLKVYLTYLQKISIRKN